METRKRSLVKAITYRIWVTIVAFGIAYWVTGSIEKSIQVIVLYLAGSMIVYYIHERIWVNYIKWGVECNNDNSKGETEQSRRKKNRNEMLKG